MREPRSKRLIFSRLEKMLEFGNGRGDPTAPYKSYEVRSGFVGDQYAVLLELAERGHDRQPGGADRRQEPANESHQERVEERLGQQLPGDGKFERNLAERLEV